ncbi:MAG TPA: ATP-binding protein [Anaeromyxobacteraceae bacterium]|nr:ATP-binding protein [Anaeromyxobacteraceae bacterium]
MAHFIPAPSPDASGRLARRTGAIVAAGIALVAMVGYLLVLNYRSARTLRENLLRQHSQQAALHAASLSHLFAAAEKDIRNLSESREVAAFYENRDLGMSMQYGLALSLVPIQERLASLVEPREDRDPRPFMRIALLDADGSILADSAGPGAPPWEEAKPASPRPEGISLSADGKRLTLTRAHRFKGRAAGWFVAWLRPDTVLGTLAASAERLSFVLLDAQGRPYMPEGFEPWVPDLPRGIESIPADGRMMEMERPGGKGQHAEDLVAMRVPVPSQPFTLLGVDRVADLVGDLSPRASAVNLTVAVVAVLGVVLLAVILNTKSLVLQARLDESLLREQQVAEKHSALQREVAERQRLQAAHALLAVAVDQAAEGIAVTDPEGHIEYVNPALERITGFAAAELRGRPLVELYGGGAGSALTKDILATLSESTAWRGEVTSRRKDGQPFDAQVIISAVRDPSGQIANLLLVGRDVTEEKLLREHLRHRQKLEAVGTLAGGVAHDFNNLLTAINGYAGLALEGLSEGDPVREDIVEIQRAGARAADLTRQLLAFSRKQVLKPQVIALDAAVVGVEKLLRRLIGEHIELVTKRTEGLWKVKVDPGQLEQVLVNLVVNARDAMPDGGRLTISTANVTLTEPEARRYADGAAGPHVVLTVSDTGTGMDEATLAHIFEPFFTTKEQGKGTGLGLSTVYGIVRQSRGFVGVQSQAGRGTKFEIFFPPETGPSEPASVRAVEAPRTRSGKPNETVLVVEDERQVRNLLSSQLAAEGYTVLAAADGREALALADRHAGQIDLLLSDVVMPQMGGPELARAFRARHPETSVVFMSGYADEAVAGHVELDQAAAFVQKPWQLSELAGVLRRVLDHRPRA